MFEREYWTILYLENEPVGYFDSCRDARRWLDRNAKRKRNDEIYDRYERYIIKDGKKLYYSFLEFSVSKEDKEKGLFHDKILNKIM